MAYMWRSRPDVAQLERTIDQLRTENVRLRHELGNKRRHVGQLKVLTHQRSNTIDDLRGWLEQSQAQIRQLNEEADHLAELFKG
jgi:regulator of replication initiation timing